MKAGVYINLKNNLAIVYPDQTVEVWVDTNEVFFKDDKWMKFQMSQAYADFFGVDWELLWEL